MDNRDGTTYDLRMSKVTNKMPHLDNFRINRNAIERSIQSSHLTEKKRCYSWRMFGKPPPQDVRISMCSIKVFFHCLVAEARKQNHCLDTGNSKKGNKLLEDIKV